MLAAVVAMPLWLFGGSRDDVSLGLPDGAIELDQLHPAMRLLAQGATDSDSFSEAALNQGIEGFVCAGGGGQPSWELCLVADGQVLAVVPFNGVEGLTARVSDANLTHDVVVPIDTNKAVGILETGPQATVIIEYFGERVGEMSVPWATAQDGTGYVVPVELREATYQTGSTRADAPTCPSLCSSKLRAEHVGEGGWDWEIARIVAADLLEPVPEGAGRQWCSRRVADGSNSMSRPSSLRTPSTLDLHRTSA